jgi:hypothetical protein
VAATCTDTVKNGTETDIDCGGGACMTCQPGKGCAANGDCVSGVCTNGVCSMASCSDGVKNGTETDKDCGGACGPCATGGVCVVAKDCASGVCTGGVCQAPTCTDIVKNQTETDVDCGGGTCGKCADSKGCSLASDCQSAVCKSGVCQVPTCFDGAKNATETDVDCGGGACNVCNVGKACGAGSDCSTALCTGGVCTAATSCKTLLAAQPGLSSGVYTIDPDGAGGAAPFAAYCDMTNDGGGWTLAMKINGALTTFVYGSGYWTSNFTLNGASANLVQEEAKLAPFVSVPVSNVRLTVITGNATNSLVVPLAAPATSLTTLFSGASTTTTLGRKTWMNLVPGSGLQPNCNREGTNVSVGTYASARLGIITNQENDCNTPDSYLGIGTDGGLCNGGSLAAGNKAGCAPILDANGAATTDKLVSSFAFVFVR